jgi:hypothetical protein
MLFWQQPNSGRKRLGLNFHFVASEQKMLSDSDTDGEDLHQLTINEYYEKAFNARKEREELWKCISIKSILVLR